MSETKDAYRMASFSEPAARAGRAGRNALDLALKAGLDFGLTLLGVALLSPVFIALALIVRLDSPGPVVYRRRVLGRGKTQFDAFKLRTMHVNGDEILARHPVLKEQLVRDQIGRAHV